MRFCMIIITNALVPLPDTHIRLDLVNQWEKPTKIILVGFLLFIEGSGRGLYGPTSSSTGLELSVWLWVEIMAPWAFYDCTRALIWFLCHRWSLVLLLKNHILYLVCYLPLKSHTIWVDNSASYLWVLFQLATWDIDFLSGVIGIGME